MYYKKIIILENYKNIDNVIFYLISNIIKISFFFFLYKFVIENLF